MLSIRSIISVSVAITVGIVMFTVIQSVIDAQTTTTWSTLAIALIFILPSIMLLVIIVNLFIVGMRVK
jgi:hypothetical protein